MLNWRMLLVLKMGWVGGVSSFLVVFQLEEPAFSHLAPFSSWGFVFGGLLFGWWFF